MTLRPEYLTYRHDGQDEHALCFAATAARRILIVPPIFDEMNRVRRMLVQSMRHVGERGVGTFLIDLPGCNESIAPLQVQSLSTWRNAVAAAAAAFGVTHVAALRGGALVDHGIPDLPHWRLAPAKGGGLLKTMIRTRIAGDREAGRTISAADLITAAQTAPIELAGNWLGTEMVTQLDEAEAVNLPDCMVRTLGSDIGGTPLWLRAEPQDDGAMSVAIADDLVGWSGRCGG